MVSVLSAVQNDAHRFFAVVTDKFKFSSITVLLSVPKSKYSTPLSNLLMSVLARGTARHKTAGEINRYLDSLYSMSVSTRRCAFSDNFFIGATCEFLDEKFTGGAEEGLEEKAVGFIDEILFHPYMGPDGLFRSEYVEAEKTDILNSLMAVRNNARGYASMRCRELLCKNDAVGEVTYEDLISGTEKITAQALTDYYRMITENRNIVVFYIGNCEEKVRAAAEKMLASHKCDAAFPKLMPITRCELPTTASFGSEVFPVAQSKLSVGYRTDIIPTETENDVYAMEVLCEMFGGGPYSKLFSELREKRGMCYYCSSSYSKFRGIIMVNSGADVKNIDAMKDGIDRELQKLISGDFTDTELESAKLALRSAYAQIPDSTASIENYFLPRVLTMDRGQYGISHDIGKIESVTKDDILRVGKRLSHGATFAVVGSGSEGCDEDE